MILVLLPWAVAAQEATVHTGIGHNPAGHGHRDAAPERLALNPSAQMRDHTGRAVTLSDFRGKPLLLFFGFTKCEDVCPTTAKTVGVALDLMGEDAGQINTAFVSVDVRRESPESLAHFVSAVHPRLIGLTGSRKQVFDFARMFLVRHEWAPHHPKHGEAQIAHTTRLDLLSADGDILAHLPSTISGSDLAARLLEAVRDGR